MSYGTFCSISEVARKFDIKVIDKSFLRQREIHIPDIHFTELQRRLGIAINFINEITVCERIIRPILDLVEVEHTLLNVWSHVPYNVDKEKGLVGEPDYLIAPKTKYGDMYTPPICVIEAKQEKFDEGWTQALAEMVAASIQGSELCYAVVTTGKIWEFGQLKQRLFTKDPLAISATSELQRVFEILNWLFKQASINIKNKGVLDELQ